MMPRLIIGICVVLIVFTAFVWNKELNPDVMVLCSNNEVACQALVEDYVTRTGHSAQMVRMPTSEALSHIRSEKQRSEFDVWIGGPAEAYVLAEREGLLLEHGLDTQMIPESMKTKSWVGTYGGVLTFCVANGKSIPRSWQELPNYPDRLALPLPFSSGTAATMLGVLYELNKPQSFYRRLHEATTVYTASGTVPAELVHRGLVDAAVTFEAYCPIERVWSGELIRVLPSDGTGYEIGAGAVLARGRTQAGKDFLQYAISDSGQRVLTQAEGQNPISLYLPNNLASRLTTLRVPLYTEDLDSGADVRQHLMENFATNVMYPHGSVGPLLRSWGLALGGAIPATILGALLALFYRTNFRYRLVIIFTACVPILFPSVAIAAALTIAPISLDPYTPWILAVSFALYSVPICFLSCVIVTSRITLEKIMAAADSGSSSWKVVRKLFFPRILIGCVGGLVMASLWLVSDNSAGAVYGGREHLFINMALNSLTVGERAHQLAILTGLMAIAGAITSWGVAKRARWETGSPRLTSAPDAPHEFAKQFCHTFFADVRKWLLTVELVWSVVILYLVATMIFHADFSGAPTDFLSRIGIRMAVSLAVTAIAVVVGLWLAINRGPHITLVRSAMVFLLLYAPIGVGLVFTLVLRSSIKVAGFSIFPALVGGYSLGGGIIAVILAYLTLALPFSYFIATVTTRRFWPLVQVARDGGAIKPRILVLIMRHMKGQLTALVAILFGLTLTQTATLAFVQPAYLSVSSTDLISLAEHGNLGELLATSLLIGSIGGLLIVSGSVMLVVSQRGRKRTKRT